MSNQTTALLEAFDSLPEEGKMLFTAEFFRRAIPYDSGPFEDDEAVRSSDDLFAMLEAEENAKI